MPELRQFFRYVVPTMLFMFLGGLYSIIDGIFIGQATGEEGLAAVFVTFPLYCLIFGLGELIGIGGCILISQSRGAGDIHAANKIFSGMIGLGTLAGVASLLVFYPLGRPLLVALGATPDLLPGAFSYISVILFGATIMVLWVCLSSAIRNDDHPALAGWLIALGVLGNIVLDYVFIMRFGWGLPGAAWATVVAELPPLIGGILFFASKKSNLTFQWRYFVPDWETASRIFRCGIPSFGAHVAIATMLLLHNWQSLRYGGEMALAAYAAICTVESLTSMIMQGVANGIQPLVSFYYGAKEFAKNRLIGRYAILFSLLLGVFGVLFSVLVCRRLPLMMGLEGETAQIAARGLLISAAAFLTLGTIKVGSTFFQSTGRVVASAILIYGDCVVLALCLILLPIYFGLDGVWLAMPVSRMILVAMMIVLAYKPRGSVAKGDFSEVCAKTGVISREISTKRSC
ncbi:MAG: MATE family efflux transporter [Planctomycetia bacterium]|nr:MATE family efflux transporter [Planctomycetia bacterium]